MNTILEAIDCIGKDIFGQETKRGQTVEDN